MKSWRSTTYASPKGPDSNRQRRPEARDIGGSSMEPVPTHGTGSLTMDIDFVAGTAVEIMEGGTDSAENTKGVSRNRRPSVLISDLINRSFNSSSVSSSGAPENLGSKVVSPAS